MAKNIWIRASIHGCSINAGKIQLEIRCGNYQTTGEAVYANPLQLLDLPKIVCFVKGMVNSSQNALARTVDSWGPLGRMSVRFDLRYGVRIHHISNEFSRDSDIDCVESREDAEKLCLLSQRFPCCAMTLLEIARANGLDADRISTRGLKTLETAVINALRRYDIPNSALMVDDRVKAMVMAGV